MRMLVCLGIGAVFGLLVLGGLWASGVWTWNRPGVVRFPVRGIDVSHHQDRIDWTAVGMDGVQFAYVKATEGGDFVDRRFSENWSGAKRAGVARGAYHFFTFCRPGVDQARHFLSVAAAESGALLPVVDVEFVGNCADPPALARISHELRIFVDHVERAWDRPVLIYVTAEAREQVLGDGFPASPLWVRSLLGEPVEGWLVWQYSATGRTGGVQGLVDHNTLRPGASLDDLRAQPSHQRRLRDPARMRVGAER